LVNSGESLRSPPLQWSIGHFEDGFGMYSRKVSVRYGDEKAARECPLKWLDNFSMRNFTNDPMFDDTLPIADGVMEIGSRVPLDRLRSAMEDWFRKKSYLGKEQKLTLEERK
jgi:hypothetical protein